MAAVRVAMTLEQLWHRVPGGTATAALGLARALQNREDVDLVGVAARHRKGPRLGFESPCPIEQLPLPRRLLYETWNRLGRPIVEQATGPVDVVHATGMVVPGADAPVVVTVHDLAFLRYPDHATSRGQRFFERSLEAARTRSAAIICPSRATADACIDWGFAAADVHVVPWWLAWETATEEQVARVRAAHRLPERYVLWVGTIEPRKNLPRLVRAFNQMAKTRPGVHLVLAGPAGWNETVIDGVEETGRIKPIGFVPNTDLAPLYRGAEVFCYPSLLEGFGLPVLEAMSQGTAVVTSAETATAEVAGDAAALVDPEDEEALAHVLAALVDDRDRRTALGKRAAERAGLYTPDRCAEETLAVYSLVTA